MTDPLAQALKTGMRRLVSGVSVITATSPDGDMQAMTASSVTSVSAEPPSLLVCVNRETRFAPLLAQGLQMAVNVLSSSQQALSEVCANPAEAARRFDSTQWRFDQAAPYLDGAEAVFFTQVDCIYTYGTHHIVVARVQAVQVSPGSLSPLLYADGSYRQLL